MASPPRRKNEREELTTLTSMAFISGMCLQKTDILWGSTCEHGVGVSQANRREMRKLGLLLSGKSSEVKHERMEPQERRERVCGGWTDAHPNEKSRRRAYPPGNGLFSSTEDTEKTKVHTSTTKALKNTKLLTHRRKRV
ncbi:MAG: hypothetical protein A4E58_03110 [Syntrophorhabdus sp. PtaB.Bin006]|nr:MAG: hypothetical protein A4E58_03110 [Syntrophorhabdus sp. PtaB.Bin006]